MTATPPVASVDRPRVIDCAESRPNPERCPLGLPHRVGDPACTTFRRAIRAKGLNPPRGGWPCQPDPAVVHIGSVTVGRG